jgi:hypothetical protein
MHALGLRRHIGEQRPGIQERGLVGMILEGHQIEPGPPGRLRERDDLLGLLGLGRDERPEYEVVS